MHLIRNMGIPAPMPRTIAIGDIHGCSRALAGLIEAIEPRPEDRLIPLGDYIDGGPDSRGVIDQLIALTQRCQLIPLLGNHEEMLREARLSLRNLNFWLMSGGRSGLASYGTPGGLELIPQAHFDFLETCCAFHETDKHIFVHAHYLPLAPLAEQDSATRLWTFLDDRAPEPHCSGKTVIVGHTPQKHGEVLDLGFLKCIDTFCHGGGWLTALEVQTGQLWQVDIQGQLRGS